MMNTDTCTVYADALCIVTLSVCCVTGTDNDTVTDIDVDIDTDTDTYTDTVDNDTAAARKLYFEITSGLGLRLGRGVRPGIESF